MTARLVLRTSLGIVLLALVIRTFVLLGVFVPIEVSASSMAPTLLGPHQNVVCDGCHHHFPVAVDHGRTQSWATCPACREKRMDVSRFPVVAGDTIWIDRTAYLLRRPHRWEMVVFRCPNDATQYCVKRIVGLPGETIDLEGGDLLVDGQRIEPPSVGGDGSPLRYERLPDAMHATGIPLPCQLGPDEYFVLGDNSSVSDDSRTWRNGPGLPRKLLIGKPLCGEMVNARQSCSCRGSRFRGGAIRLYLAADDEYRRRRPLADGAQKCIPGGADTRF